VLHSKQAFLFVKQVHVAARGAAAWSSVIVLRGSEIALDLGVCFCFKKSSMSTFKILVAKMSTVRFDRKRHFAEPA
jgi:hypothetical protein